MNKHIISAALILCSNALAMKPATKNKSLFTKTNTTNNSVSTHDLQPILEAMVKEREQAHMRNKKCTLARLLHSTSSCITSENRLFNMHTEESLKLKAKL